MNSVRIKYYYKILVLFFFITIISGQEHQSTLQIHSNPKNSTFWWLEKNNYGKSIVGTEIEYQWKLKNKKIAYQITVSNAYKSYTSEHNASYNNFINYTIKHPLLLGESFIKYNFSDNTYLRVGQYYRDFSQYLNDDLSSGSMIISKNAQAIPKIGLVTNKNIGKNINFNFGMAHGKLGDEGYYTKAPFLHEKFLYMTINRDKKDQISIGFVHEAIWGGATPESGQHPDTFEDFLKIFISADGPYGAPHANALGSHIGIWDFYYEKNNNEKKLKLYYQHFFEDTSSLRFANSIDGLWGLELNNYIPNTTTLIEYLDTTHSSTVADYGNDYYYWNYQYRLGWAYKSRIIGNPFVNTNYFTEEQFIKLINIGINGTIFSNQYQIKAARKIDVHDSIKFKFMLSKSISSQTTITTFLVGEDSNYGLGISMSYSFN